VTKSRIVTSAGALALIAVFAATFLGGCANTYPRRDPTGEPFPRVIGSSLEGEEVVLPDVGSGDPLLLLVGYKQNSQFDIDRWLIGLFQTGIQVKAYEVPTISGMIPGMISGTINRGMQRGIPSEDWGGVVTVYGDADKIARFTGNADGLNGRILVLDGSGKVAFFHDQGFSVKSLQRMRERLDQLGR
jgi:hypothetical protein